jgi:hypothetical protein
MQLLSRIVLAGIVALLGVSRPAWAEAPAQLSGGKSGWDVAVYPVLVWLPVGIGIDVELPPDGGHAGGSGSIVDSRFDGAYLGGASISNGRWRIDADAIWAGVGGDRIERPSLTVDADIIYGHAMVGYAIARDFYITGGIRRLALKYDIKLADLPNFSRKPGVWDPLVGVGYHRVGRTFEVHGIFEGGGFGAGADVDLGASLRADWKFIPHFGITAGYSVLYFKLSDTDSDKTFKVKQTLHGPVAGIGLYF